MRLSLRPGERVYVNGAVLRVDRKVGIELLNDATFLLEAHVLQAEDATTPLRQLYFAAQTMLIDPSNAGPARSLFASLQAGILALTGSAAIRDGLSGAEAHLAAGRPFEALKVIRALYPAEAALLSESGPPAETASAKALAPPALPGPRIETRHRRPAGPRAATLPPRAAAGPRPATTAESKA